MSSSPQSTSLVALWDEYILYLGVGRLNDLKGIICRPVEVPVITYANILRRDILQDLVIGAGVKWRVLRDRNLIHNISNLWGALVTRNHNSNAAKKIGIVLERLSFIKSVGKEKERQKEYRYKEVREHRNIIGNLWKWETLPWMTSRLQHSIQVSASKEGPHQCQWSDLHTIILPE